MVLAPRSRLVIGALAVLVGGCRGGGAGTGGAGTAGGSAGAQGAAGTSGAAGSGSSDAGPTDDAAPFSREALLGAFATCAASHAHVFRERAAALDAAVKALVATPDPAAQTAAREAFGGAMDAWETMEVLQYGPTASTLVPGGRGVRDNVYAWPTFGRCAVEEEIVAKSYESPTFATTALVNRRGLAALDYLLFHEGADGACQPGSPELAAWSALSVDERAARMRAYAGVVAADVLKRAVTLDEAWDPVQGNFVQTMRSAGPGNAVYMTPQVAIQSVGVALFYFDGTVKHGKLGDPLDAMCASAACLEAPFSKRAKTSLRINIEGARLLLDGCEAGYAGLGFDDLLASMGASGVATTMREQLLAAQGALDAIEEADLGQALAQDAASVEAVRAAIATFTTTLKTMFITTLGFDVGSVPTDND